MSAKDCPEYIRLFGRGPWPEHSIYGGYEGADCNCFSCAGPVEEAEAHVKACAICRPPVTHDGTTTNDFGSDDWTAECSCGWTSAPVKSEAEAAKALGAHYAGIGGT